MRELVTASYATHVVVRAAASRRGDAFTFSVQPARCRSRAQCHLSERFLDATWKIQTERLVGVAARAEQSSGAGRTGTDDDGR